MTFSIGKEQLGSKIKIMIYKKSELKKNIL